MERCVSTRCELQRKEHDIPYIMLLPLEFAANYHQENFPRKFLASR